MRRLMVDRNLGNSAIAVLDALAEDAEDRVEHDAQRRAEEQAEHECVAREWLQCAATPESLADHMDTPTWCDALDVLLELARGNAIGADALRQLQRRAVDALMPSALEATRGA